MEVEIESDQAHIINNSDDNIHNIDAAVDNDDDNDDDSCWCLAMILMLIMFRNGYVVDPFVYFRRNW